MRRPPHNRRAEFAATLNAYGVREVAGDRYAGEFPRELWRSRNIKYELSEKAKSDIYRE